MIDLVISARCLHLEFDWQVLSIDGAVATPKTMAYSLQGDSASTMLWLAWMTDSGDSGAEDKLLSKAEEDVGISHQKTKQISCHRMTSG